MPFNAGSHCPLRAIRRIFHEEGVQYCEQAPTASLPHRHLAGVDGICLSGADSARLYARRNRRGRAVHALSLRLAGRTRAVFRLQARSRTPRRPLSWRRRRESRTAPRRLRMPDRRQLCSCNPHYTAGPGHPCDAGNAACVARRYTGCRRSCSALPRPRTSLSSLRVNAAMP
jgi:hypothetical protein